MKTKSSSRSMFHVRLFALSGLQVGLQDSSDEILGKRRAIEVIEEPTYRVDERRPKGLGRAKPVEDEVRGLLGSRASRPTVARSSGRVHPFRAVPRRTRRAPLWPSLAHITSSKSNSPMFSGVSRDSSGLD